MKIITTFWSDKVHEFSELLYIHGNTKEILFRVDLNNIWATYKFFNDIAKFVKSPLMQKNIYSEEYYQFAVIYENNVSPIVWFNLVINEQLTISHDLAFDTTLIKKNGLIIPFGHFPMWYWKKDIKLPTYRKLNLKARAYKYMGNQVKFNFSKTI